MSSIVWWKFAIVFGVYVCLRALVVQGIAFWCLAKMKWAQAHRIFRLPWSGGQLQSELRASIPVVLVDSVFVGATIDYLPSQSQLGPIPTFLIAFIWLEIVFYVWHRALHHPRLFWMHKQHHVAQVTSPMTSLSFSALERAGLLFLGLLPLVIIAQWWPLSVAGLAAYFLVNYLLNVAAHTNVEILPFGWLRRFPGRGVATPTFHALHHARYKGNYGLFTTYLDDGLGTAFEDYVRVHERVSRGEGLHQLVEKVPPAHLSGSSESSTM